MARSSQRQAAATRSAIVERTAELGSVEGLEGVSIGRLATELGMSKSGVIGHFGSKEELQLAALGAAIEDFRRQVWDPAAGERARLPRLLALADSWLSYLERRTYPGGCLLSAASHEFDDRPGPVRDAVADALERWLGALEAEARTAQEAGELPEDLDARQVAFELQALTMGANWAHRLHRDAAAFDRARAGVARLLGQAATGSS